MIEALRNRQAGRGDKTWTTWREERLARESPQLGGTPLPHPSALLRPVTSFPGNVHIISDHKEMEKASTGVSLAPGSILVELPDTISNHWRGPFTLTMVSASDPQSLATVSSQLTAFLSTFLLWDHPHPEVAQTCFQSWQPHISHGSLSKLPSREPWSL